MKTILTSFWMEARISFTRDFLLIFLYTLTIFFEKITDFPFQIEIIEKFGPSSELSMILISCCIFLAIFCRTIFRDLDDREYYSQHPLNYRQHFFGKYIYICVIFVLISSIDLLIPLLRDIYYSSSLVAYDFSDLLDALAYDLSTGLYMAGLLLFVSLFRPFHYAFLIATVSAVFYLAQTWPYIKDWLPIFTLERSKLLPYLLYSPIFCLLGMILFEHRMTLAPKQKKAFFKKLSWVKKAHPLKWVPTLIMLMMVGLIFRLVGNQIDLESSPFESARTEFMQSVRQIKNQTSLPSEYFSFKFQKDNQWIFEELSKYADKEWEMLHKEFSIPFKKEDQYQISVFIKASQKHQLGSTRGSFIVINAETLNASANKKSALKRTFRHELAHVLINHLSQYQFSIRRNILSSFLHEGLATLVDHNWDPNDKKLIEEAALHFKTYDQSFFEMLPKLGYFSPYDYRLNYSLGYVFWAEFVKLYGQKSVKTFLNQLGKYDEEESQFEGISFLFHKSNLAKIDLYKAFHASKLKLDASYKTFDPSIKMETKRLKHFKAARLNKNEILIPYPFTTANRVHCLFRKRGSLLDEEEAIFQQKEFSGRKGGICTLPKENMNEVQLLIRLKNELIFYSPWIAVPEL